MEGAIAVIELVAHDHLGGHFVPRNVRDFHAHEVGERRLQFGVGIHRSIHSLGYSSSIVISRPERKGRGKNRALAIKAEMERTGYRGCGTTRIYGFGVFQPPG